MSICDFGKDALLVKILWVAQGCLFDREVDGWEDRPCYVAVNGEVTAGGFVNLGNFWD